MKEVSVLRYYSNGTYSDPLSAAIEADKLREKHPDREYDIIMNMRSGYTKLTVVQVSRYVEMWPEEEDLSLGPPPPRPPTGTPHYGPGSQPWDDYRFECQKRQLVIDKVTRPLKDKLRKALNRR